MFPTARFLKKDNLDSNCHHPTEIIQICTIIQQTITGSAVLEGSSTEERYFDVSVWCPHSYLSLLTPGSTPCFYSSQSRFNRVWEIGCLENKSEEYSCISPTHT